MHILEIDKITKRKYTWTFKVWDVDDDETVEEIPFNWFVLVDDATVDVFDGVEVDDETDDVIDWFDEEVDEMLHISFIVEQKINISLSSQIIIERNGSFVD